MLLLKLESEKYQHNSNMESCKIICQLQAWFDVNYVGKPN